MRNSRAGMPPHTRHARRGEIGKRLVRDVVRRIDDRLQHVARARPGDGELRPLLGDRDHLHVELGPQHLLAELEVLHHLGRVGGGGGHEVVVLGEPRGGAVVQHEAVLAQHQPVARLADRQRREGVGVDAVEEDAGVRCPARRSCRASRRRRRRPRARTVATSRLTASSQSPRRAAGNTARAATARSRRTPRPAPRAQRCDGGEPRRAEVLPAVMPGEARRWRPACRAGGRSWCRPRRS